MPIMSIKLMIGCLTTGLLGACVVGAMRAYKKYHQQLDDEYLERLVRRIDDGVIRTTHNEMIFRQHASNHLINWNDEEHNYITSIMISGAHDYRRLLMLRDKFTKEGRPFTKEAIVAKYRLVFSSMFMK